MLLDISLIKNKEERDGVIIGESKVGTELLDEGELMIIAPGLHTYLEFIQKEFPNAAKDKSSSKTGRGSFNHFKSFKECIQTFTEKPHTLIKFDPHEMQINDFLESGNDVEYDVTGDFIDIGRHLEGIPESFGSMHNGNIRNRRVRICLNRVFSCDTEKKDILYQSERIIRLIDSLENAKVRTEVISIHSGRCLHSEVAIKHFDEPLSIEDLAVATNPDMLRRIDFRAIEHSKTFFWGYGKPETCDNCSNVFNSDMNNEITIYITGGHLYGKDRLKDKFDKIEKKLSSIISDPQPPKEMFIKI